MTKPKWAGCVTKRMDAAAVALLLIETGEPYESVLAYLNDAMLRADLDAQVKSEGP